VRNHFARSVPRSVPFYARPLGVLGLCVALAACSEQGERDMKPAVAGGDPARGQGLMAQYQCTACHAIPGVPGAAGNAGPPLDGFGRRSYIAGGIPNTPGALARWLDNPQSMKPGTPMPDLGVSLEEARHMAAYLATLR
jgi:cytochrome c2